MFAVVVTFQIVPGQMEAFLPLIRANAHGSLTHEEGCHQFDVATDPDRPDEVFLYELYTDEAAFKVHQTMPHFKTCGAATGHMVAAKDLRTYSNIHQ